MSIWNKKEKYKSVAANYRWNAAEAAAAGPRRYKLKPTHCTLTDVGSAQSFAQRPRPDVRSLAVDGQTLNTAHEAAIRSSSPDQPIGAGGSAHVQWRSECDLAVLALKENHSHTLRATHKIPRLTNLRLYLCTLYLSVSKQSAGEKKRKKHTQAHAHKR